MYCPNCAAQNIDGAQFCRACGKNISLVPQAMSGHLPAGGPAEFDGEGRGHKSRRRHRQRESASMEKGIKNLFIGLGFLVVSIALSFSIMGMGWWFWMLIPAFSLMGGGVAEMMRARRAENRQLPYGPTTTAVPPVQHAGSLPPRNTSELMPSVPSVTEGTTRHLGVEAPTRHFGAAVENPEKKV